LVHLGASHEKVLKFVPIEMQTKIKNHKKLSHNKSKLNESTPTAAIEENEEQRERNRLKIKIKDDKSKIESVGESWVSRWQARRPLIILV
jgi:hypothetical protein